MTVATLFDADVYSLYERTSGRSDRLLALRDKALSTRYFYYMRYKHYNYIKACEELSNEFYISVVQVQKVLKANSATLQGFKKEPLSVKELCLAYPHITWS